MHLGAQHFAARHFAARHLGTRQASGAASGAKAATLAGVALLAAGQLAVGGQATPALVGVSLASSGQAAIAAQAARTLGGAGLAAAGALPGAGSYAGALEGVSLASAGATALAGVRVVALDGAIAAATGQAPVLGSSSRTLAGAALAADGFISSGAIDPAVVWESVLVGGYTAGDLLRGMAAVLAGKSRISSTGAGQAHIEFDAIDGSGLEVTVEASGSERTSASLATLGNGHALGGNAALIWGHMLQGGYTAGDVLRILAAVAAGRTDIDPHGAGKATVTFRSIDDSRNAVVAQMAGSERISLAIDATY